MKNYRLNPAAFRGTTVDLENWDKNSIIDIRLKTNVKEFSLMNIGILMRVPVVILFFLNIE
jgi:hypothetical protein